MPDQSAAVHRLLGVIKDKLEREFTPDEAGWDTIFVSPYDEPTVRAAVAQLLQDPFNSVINIEVIKTEVGENWALSVHCSAM